MAAFISAEELRGFVGNAKVDDSGALQLAVDVACSKVVDLCGPIQIETVTDELVGISGADEACLHWRVRELLAVKDAGGAALTLSEWRASGQRLRRRDGGRIWSDLLVSYSAGYATVGERAPAWARSMALHIAQQHLRTQRRFATPQDQAPTGFLVPKVALEEGADYLLTPGGLS